MRVSIFFAKVVLRRGFCSAEGRGTARCRGRRSRVSSGRGHAAAVGAGEVSRACQVSLCRMFIWRIAANLHWGVDGDPPLRPTMRREATLFARPCGSSHATSLHAADRHRLFTVGGVRPTKGVDGVSRPRRRQGRVAIVNAKGEVEWQAPTRGEVHDLALLPDGHLLLPMGPTKVVEMNRDGKIVWEYESKPKADYKGGSRSTPSSASTTAAR